MSNRLLGYAAAVGVVVTAVLANVLTSRYGFVSLGFGLSASAGTYAAGAALGLRDAVQSGLGKRAVLAVIAVGAALSYVFADVHIATASAVAFGVAELSDLLIYTPLRARGWRKAVVASNAVGGVVDTLVFLYLAGFPMTAAGFEGQLVGKLLYATLIPVALVSAVGAARRTA